MQPLIDCHNHSRHSFDGCEPVAEVCRRAEELGLAAFALTDHCDLHRFPADYLRSVICNSVDELARWRSENPTRVRLLTGFELGEPIDFPDLADEMLALRDVDVVLGSIHRAGDLVDFSLLDCQERSLDDLHALLDDYFDRLLRTVEWGKCDVLTHITYPLRYIVGKWDIPLTLDPWRGAIDQLFKAVAESGMALEINSSGLRQKIGVPLPDGTLLRRYYELGGRRISLGSDAHQAADIGSGIGACQQLLKGIGFTEVCYFVERRPHFIAL